MTEHIHRCLSCRPDMVPDFDRNDPRYHDGEKCGHGLTIRVDGVELSYTKGAFEGHEGWVIFAGESIEAIHPCSCADRTTGQGMTCLEPRFGHVEVVHACPSELVSDLQAMREALRPFAHHCQAGDHAKSDRERSIRVTVGQITRAWFALNGEPFS